MSLVVKFEDLEAWQKARELTKHIYIISRDSSFSRDYGLRDQMRRAAVSVMSNIAEGFNRGSNRELVRYLYIAKGSASEIQAQAYVALDVGYISQEQFHQIYTMTGEACRLIGGFIRYLKSQS